MAVSAPAAVSDTEPVSESVSESVSASVSASVSESEVVFGGEDARSSGGWAGGDGPRPGAGTPGHRLGHSLAVAPCSAPRAEGSHSTGRNQRERYANAMSSARESIACLETAACLGYLDDARLAPALDELDHVVAMLFELRRR